MFCWWKFVVRERHHARLLQGLYCAGVSCSFQLTFPAFPSETKRGKKKSARHLTERVAQPTTPVPKSRGSVCPPLSQVRFLRRRECSVPTETLLRAVCGRQAKRFATLGISFFRATSQWDPVTD